MDGSVLTARPVLGAADLGRAQWFWCEVMGFQLAVERPGFVLFRAGDAEVAVEQRAPVSPGSVFLHVRGVEALHERCREAGLAIVQELHLHDSGRRDFAVADPDGNRVGVGEKPRLGGRIGWVDLTVPEAEPVRDFWKAVVGFDGLEPCEMGGYEDWSLTSDGRPVAGVCHARGANAGLPPVWMVYFTVDHLEEALAEVEAREGTVVKRQERMAVVRDPGGTVAALFQG